MTDRMAGASHAAEQRQQARDALYEWVERRDILIIAALSAGVSAQEIAAITDTTASAIEKLAQS
jgi:hypothetical protein